MKKFYLFFFLLSSVTLVFSQSNSTPKNSIESIKLINEIVKEFQLEKGISQIALFTLDGYILKYLNYEFDLRKVSIGNNDTNSGIIFKCTDNSDCIKTFVKNSNEIKYTRFVLFPFYEPIEVKLVKEFTRLKYHLKL